ncbi:alpha,alpha-trehalose-phosphate synthase (UDP-forming) [Algihabitans albus]|uniref:alpha,alpha-trehalose-phosphate synthase (UDP-forming) n=1 Tax=Algihabitans albus TaxID=2164067 RepID=UPI001F24A458|nr:alpha,alpha-trehalose-phosphate synthase (UDP-forming) [Algihabitans albus]
MTLAGPAVSSKTASKPDRTVAKRRLVVVSNRVAVPRPGRTGGEGGLAVGVKAALEESGGMWFGWSGKTIDHEKGEPDAADLSESGPITYATIDLTQRDYDEYYNGFANRSIWPLFHYRLDLADFNRRYLAGYQRVNALFARRLAPLLRADDLLWIHDYHLIPMAEQLRHMGCRQIMGFFLHIPWPAMEVLLALPNQRALVQSLCAYDLVGFQTEDYRKAFLDYCQRELSATILEDGTVEAFGRRVRTGTFPISIDTEPLAKAAEEASDSRQIRRLRESVRNRDLIIGVDRLDYSKGLLVRVQAYEHLLRAYPANRGRVVMLQIAPPSRMEVPEYMQLRHEMEGACGHLNGAFAEFDWTPVRYLNKGFSRRMLAGFYRTARVGLVTPLRDGMNLVAKEYVASQDPEDPGVLVLSRFAGAARELDGALIVNPYDLEATAEAMQTALSLDLEERRERYRTMFKHLQTYDIDRWREDYLSVLAA